MRTVRRRYDDVIELHNDFLRLNTPQHTKNGGQVPPAAFGTRIFATQAIQAKELGVEIITTQAAGDYSQRDRWMGYYVWPCCGYDADIPYGLRQDLRQSTLPEHLRQASMVSELIAASEGREWWMFNGQTIHATFWIGDGSVSEEQLLSYLEEKGIRL